MSRLAGIFTFTACALRASAFLLPPNVALASDDDANALSLAGPLSTTNAVIQLPCSECAFSASQSSEKIEEVEDEPLFWIQGGANSVLVNFTVSEDGQRLEVNGEPIYPLGLLEADIFHSPKMYVSQVRSGVSLADVEAGTERVTPLEVTGHSISIQQQDEDMLIPVVYNIYSLNGQPVTLDEVTVNLLQLPEGIAIISMTLSRPEFIRPDDFFGPPPEEMPEDFFFPPPPPEFDEPEMDKPDFGRQKECNMLPAPLCKLRNMIESKIMGVGKEGGCHGRKGPMPHGGKLPSHIRPHFRPDGAKHERPPFHHGHFFHPEMDEHEPPHHPPHHGGRPHHMRPHHHHGHHSHHFMHAFTRGLAAVLIPTMAGIAVGMTVSLVGLIAGRIVGFLWIKLYRGGRRGYASVALDDSAADDIDAEKEVVDDEPLPIYELAPAYEEIYKEVE